MLTLNLRIRHFIFSIIFLSLQTGLSAQQLHVEGKTLETSVLIEQSGLSGIYIDSTFRHGIQIDKAGFNGIYINRPNMSGISIDEPTQDGLYVGSALKNGVRIASPSEDGIHITNAVDDGLYIDGGYIGLNLENQVSRGLKISKCDGRGIEIDSTVSHGIHIEDAGVDAIMINRPTDDGIHIQNPGDNGLVILNPEDNGIYVQGAESDGAYLRDCDGTGLYVHNAGDIGVRVLNAGQDGMTVYGAVRHAATFANESTSDDAAVVIDHGSSTKVDLLFNDKAIIKSEGPMECQSQSYLHYMDQNDALGNAFFQVIRSPAQGANYSFITYESGNSYFRNDVSITGNISKGSGTFKIDHPVDPENKFLYHSFVESPDMMNVYNGNITLDENGRATVILPAYFEALNRDFRYQLTSIGSPGPNLYIEEEVKNLTFVIAGGAPGSKVSWQITGIRQDPYANANRVQVEVEKNAQEKGTFLHPDAYQTKASSSSLPALDETNRELQN